MATAPEEMLARAASLEAPRKVETGLWRGIYSDGLRAGIWTKYDKRVNDNAKEIIKDHDFSWLPTQKIWVGPIRKLDAMAGALSSSWPDLYPQEYVAPATSYAIAHEEPFWAMAARPTLSHIDDEHWLFRFPYDAVTIDCLKRSGQARWDADRRAWRITASRETVLELLDSMRIPERYVSIGNIVPVAGGGWMPYAVNVDPGDLETERVHLQVGGAEKALESSMTEEERAAAERAAAEADARKELIQKALYEPMSLLDVDPDEIHRITEFASLMPHQIDGVHHFLARTSALNGDDMGLGKTRQTVAAAGSLDGGKVIVCPASLKDNWAREIKMVYPDAEPFVFDHDISDEQPAWLIVNYERVGALLTQLDAGHDWHFTVLAIDEAHYLKEPGAQRTMNCFDLAKRADRKWLLTATPMLNEPQETWTLLRLSGHPAGELDISDFIDHFSGSRNDRMGLGERISEWMIRRTKDEALKLPGKYRQEPLISADEAAMQEYEGFMGNNNLTALQKIGKGRQWLERVKCEPILEMLGELQPDAKAIIFTNFTATVTRLMKHLGDSAVRLTGAENRKQRDAAAQRFQNDPSCRWFVGNIKAAGVGLNLTAAAYVFFVSRPWTPGEQSQAEDRAYRIGQNRRVEVYVPTVPGTIDEDIRDLLISKQEITDDVLIGAAKAREERRNQDREKDGAE